MKLTAGKRILMFFHWLFSVLICAALTAWIIAPEFVKSLYARATFKLSATQILILGIALLTVYVMLSVAQAYLIFHRGKRRDRGFITVDSSDTGRVRIAISAIEQMVRQSVTHIDGISDMKIGIQNLDDAIGIEIAAGIYNGSHVPTITMNMQRAIRQFVEMNCGVAVRTVSININTVTNAQEGRGRRGRRRDAAAVQPPMVNDSYEAPQTTTYAPVQETPSAPVIEPEPETVEAPVIAAEPEAPAETVEEAPQAEEYDFETRPIRLTLDYDAPIEASDDSAETPEGIEE